MGNVISEQLVRFLQSILLGGVLGLVYDLVRPLRQMGGSVWCAALDALVSAASVACVFFFTMAGDGELRLFVLLGAVGGAVLFFCLLSRPLRPVWAFWFRTLTAPARLMGKILKNLWKICRKLFSFWKSGFTIMENTLHHRAEGTGDGDESMTNGQTRTEKATRRPSSRLTALLLLILMVGIGVQLYHMYDQLRTARQEEQVYAQQLAQLQQTNQQLEEDIANSGDADMIGDIARNSLGMAEADEKIFRVGK